MNTYQPEVVLYVNQNVSNFDVLAYARPQHVFLSHGESDKVYMVSNQAKAYDLTFVAGQAAVDRYRAALHDFDTDAKLRVIGRPQLHVERAAATDLPPRIAPRPSSTHPPRREAQPRWSTDRWPVTASRWCARCCPAASTESSSGRIRRLEGACRPSPPQSVRSGIC